MATIVGPFFSVTASGSISNILTASDWKGIAVMKIYTPPVNKQTPEQTAHRTLYSQAIHAWRTYLPHVTRTPSWNRLAKLLPTPMSGYNMCVSSLIPVLRDDPLKVMVWQVQIIHVGPLRQCNFYCKNMLTNLPVVMMPPVDIFFSLKASSIGTRVLHGPPSAPITYPTGTVFYASLIKEDIWRSGMIRCVAP